MNKQEFLVQFRSYKQFFDGNLLYLPRNHMNNSKIATQFACCLRAGLFKIGFTQNDMHEYISVHNMFDSTNFFPECKTMKMPATRLWRRCAALALLMTLSTLTMPANAATPLTGQLRPVIERFLLSQTAGLPGKVGITIDTPMSGALPACDTAEPFLPNGARLWGRLSVGVRCNAGQPWTRYVPVRIAVVANYYVATRTINAGEALATADFELREGDLTTLPRSVITNASQLDGVVAVNRIASGAPLRLELLRGAIAVHSGQNVRVVTQGTGFVASTEGRAMTNAAVGAVVQVKTQNGQMVSGIVREDGSVEISN